jgi:hypothetical protein
MFIAMFELIIKFLLLMLMLLNNLNHQIENLIKFQPLMHPNSAYFKNYFMQTKEVSHPFMH